MRKGTRGQYSSATVQRKGRWLGALATGSFALVAMIALLLPASAAMAPMTVTHTIRITGPYTGSTASPSSSVSMSGCGTASLVTPPFFHWRTGQAGLSGSSAAHVCASGLGASASTSESISTAVPIAVLDGTNHILVKWTAHFDGGQGMHFGKCTIPVGGAINYAYCYAQASSSLSAYAYIYDATNGSYIYPSNSTFPSVSSSSYVFESCYSGNCSTYTYGAPGIFSFAGSVFWHFHGTGLVASHAYWLETAFYGSQSATVASYGASLGPSHAQAWLNFGTFGNGATLDSVTVR